MDVIALGPYETVLQVAVAQALLERECDGRANDERVGAVVAAVARGVVGTCAELEDRLRHTVSSLRLVGINRQGHLGHAWVARGYEVADAHTVGRLDHLEERHRDL